MHPVWIQRKRAKGYNLQAVSRAANGLDGISVTRPGRWGFHTTSGFPVASYVKADSESGKWRLEPGPVKNESDSIFNAAYATHLAFMKRFTGDYPLSAAGSELRGLNSAVIALLPMTVMLTSIWAFCMEVPMSDAPRYPADVTGHSFSSSAGIRR